MSTGNFSYLNDSSDYVRSNYLEAFSEDDEFETPIVLCDDDASSREGFVKYALKNSSIISARSKQTHDELHDILSFRD